MRYRIIEVLGLDKFHIRVSGDEENAITLVVHNKQQVQEVVPRKESSGGQSSPRKYSMGTSQRLAAEEKAPEEVLLPNSVANRYLTFANGKKAKEWFEYLKNALISLPPVDLGAEESTDLYYGWKNKVY